MSLLSCATQTPFGSRDLGAEATPAWEVVWWVYGCDKSLNGFLNLSTCMSAGVSFSTEQDVSRGQDETWDVWGNFGKRFERGTFRVHKAPGAARSAIYCHGEEAEKSSPRSLGFRGVGI